MTPEVLLIETEKAVGTDELMSCHNKLIVDRTEEKRLMFEIEINQAALANLNSRQANDHRELQRIQEREKIVQNITALKVQTHFAKYQEARNEYQRLSNLKKDSEDEYARVNKVIAPLKSKLKIMKNRQKIATEEAEAADERLNVQKSRVEKFQVDLGNFDAKMQEHHKLIQDAKAKEEATQRMLREKLGELQKARKLIQNAPKEGRVEEINRERVFITSSLLNSDLSL